MFGDLTAAFGFTVLLCMTPSLLVSLGVAFVLIRVIRPKPKPNAKPNEKPKRNLLAASIAYAQFYVLSMIVLVMASVLFWWGFIALSGGQAAADFAAQTFAVEETELDPIVEPLEPTVTP